MSQANEAMSQALQAASGTGAGGRAMQQASEQQQKAVTAANEAAQQAMAAASAQIARAMNSKGDPAL
ncbi:hypothetical protein [Azospirillum brasilense]|nr:hypothetical protein [Azospirillum brasilense]